MADAAPRIFLAQYGSVVLFEAGEVWVLLDDRWMNLTGRYAAAFKNVFEGRGDSSTLESLKKTRMPYTENLVEIAQSKDKTALAPPLSADEHSLLFVELTEKCNLRCIHCYAESAPSREAFLSKEMARRTLQEAAALEYHTVQLTGGEPLLHPHIAELTRLAAELQIPNLEIFTNGNLLTAEFLNEIPQTTSFALSFYSHNLAVHDQITGELGSGAATLAAIDLLVSRGFKIRVGTILMDENRADWPRTREFLMERGIAEENLRTNEVAAMGRGRPGVSSNLDVETPLCGDLSSKQDFAEGLTKQYSWTGKACVAPSGDVYPCIFARWIKLGNLGRHSLSKILARAPELQRSELSVPERWSFVSQRLSCNDCRMLAFCLMEPA